MRPSLAALLATGLAAAPVPAFGWGYEGHEAIAAIARAYLTDTARAKVDAILATDPDTSTGPDMIARSTWADAWRSAGHRETAEWHFVDIELDHPDLRSACFDYPEAQGPASAGPSDDCVVDKVEEFAAELAAPQTTAAERLLALKYLLHFVGDLHQPLHSADNHDKGGNCVLLSLGDARTVNLHAWWDTSVVKALGSDPVALGAELRARITPAQKTTWQRGGPQSWATESFAVARSVAYTIGSPPGCTSDSAPRPLPSGYEAEAKAAAAIQIERAGVRLALVLNRALDPAISPNAPQKP
ncbi:S1/P1 nuclease [Sphingomonas oryzagri]